MVLARSNEKNKVFRISQYFCTINYNILEFLIKYIYDNLLKLYNNQDRDKL
jgi:hypothetical protein